MPSRAVVLGAMLASLSGAAHAATLEVTIRDSGGAPVENAIVQLVDPVDGWRARSTCTPTNPSGLSSCTNVKPGRWRVSVAARDAFLAAPGAHELLPPALVTIGEGADIVKAQVTLVRMDRLLLTLVVAERVDGTATVHLHDLSSDARLETYASTKEAREILLPPGRWRITVDPPGGFFLTGLELGGVNLPAPVATLDIVDPGRRDLLGIYVSSPCHVGGALSWSGTPYPPAHIVARLVALGPFASGARARGEQIAEVVTARMDKQGVFELHLLDGTWRLSAEGERVASSDPPFIDLTLGAGDDATADFSVTLKPDEDDGRVRIAITLRDASGMPLNGGFAEIWQSRDGATTKVDGKECAGRSVCSFRVTPGPYLVAGGHRNALPVSQEVIVVDKEEDEKNVFGLRLGRGASITADARTKEAWPFANVQLVIEPVDVTGATPPTDPELLAQRATRRLTFDATAQVSVPGLTPGTYRIYSRFREGVLASHRLRVGTDDKHLEDVLEVALDGEQKLALVVRPEPAAILSARLACAGGEELPIDLELQLCAENAALDPFGEKEPCRGVHHEKRLALAGRERDVLRVGGLPRGRFVVAMRPRGFDRWTFSQATEDPAQAAAVALVPGATAALGRIAIDCAPSLRLVVTPKDDSTVPPLDGVSVEALVDVVTTGEESAGPLRTRFPVRRLDVVGRSVVVHELPERTLDVSARLDQRFLVPGRAPAEPPTSRWASARGRELVLAVPIETVGGVIEIASAAAEAARLLDAEGGVVATVRREEGPLRFEHVPAGAWRVALCADADCGAPEPPLEVDVSAAQTAIAGPGP